MDFINIFNQTYIDNIRARSLYPKIKVELLDELENTISEITNDISSSNAGALSINAQQGTRATISFSIFDTDGEFMPTNNGPKLWIKRKIKVSIGIQNLQSTSIEPEIYWYSKGVFVVKDISVSTNAQGRIISISAVDKFGLFTNDTGFNELQGSYVIPAGQPICAAIEGLLNQDTGNGYPIDPIQPIFPPDIVNEVAPFDIIKGPGSYLGDFLIEIANVLGCSIFYNTEGNLTFSIGTIDSTYEGQSSIWDFVEEDGEYTSDGLVYNLADVVNVVRVVGSNINEKIFTSVAENNNPSSNTRIDLIGRKEKYITSSFVYNQERADEYAEYELSILSMTQTSLSFITTFMPHLEVDKVISLTREAYGYEREKFIIKSLSYSFSGGTVNISAVKMSDLPYHSSKRGS